MHNEEHKKFPTDENLLACWQVGSVLQQKETNCLAQNCKVKLAAKESLSVKPTDEDLDPENQCGRNRNLQLNQQRVPNSKHTQSSASEG